MIEYDGGSDSCETFDYGEVEDYLVNIVSPNDKLQDLTAEIFNNYKVMEIYPNPFKANVTIDLLSNITLKDARLTVLDNNGLLKFSDKVNVYQGKFTVNLSDLQAGIYFLQLSGDNTLWQVKALKQ